MDRATAREAYLAEYIANLSSLTHEELIQELIELKSFILEVSADPTSPYATRRHIKN